MQKAFCTAIFLVFFILAGSFLSAKPASAQVINSGAWQWTITTTDVVSQIAFDSSGNLYTVDNSNSRFRKYNISDRSIAWTITTGINAPQALAIDSNNVIYVANTGNRYIRKYDTSGTFLGQITPASAAYWIKIDATDNIWVSDSSKHIKKLDATGAVVATYGTIGSGDGQFTSPLAFDFDTSGNIYVADYSANRIQKFNSAFVFQWAASGPGSAPGLLNTPWGLTVDSINGYVYVADQSNQRVQRFSTVNGAFLNVFAATGTGNGQVQTSWALAMDPAHSIYMSSTGASGRIQKSTSDVILYQIDSLNASLDVTASAVSIKTGTSNGVNNASTTLTLKTSAGKTISDISVNMTSDRVWSSVTGDSNATSGKAFTTNLVSAPGAAASQTLYVPVPTGKTSANLQICPSATSLTDISMTCSGGVALVAGSYSESFGSGTISQVSNLGDGLTYWKITGFTGNGAYAITGFFIVTKPANINVVVADSWSTDTTTTEQLGVVPVGVVTTSGQKVAQVNVNFIQDLAWASAVTSGANESQAFFHVSAGSQTIADLPGYDSAGNAGFALYVKKGNGDSVQICPGAASLSSISLTCAGGYSLSEGQSHGAVSVSLSDAGTYWKISGLTGTGAMSLISGTLKDTMSRLQIATASNHSITFGTNLGVASNETFTIQFDSAGLGFDIGSLAIADIQLTDTTNAVRTLAAANGAGIWGVVISNTTDTITFTAPTNSTGIIAGATQVIVNIGNSYGGTHQISNPATVGAYFISIVLNNSAVEQADIAVPIVDSDQVNITSYINTYIYFDIDTAVADLDCTVAVCQLYGDTGSPAGSYIVDLGELNSTYVNISNGASVMHSNGSTGVINSIYLDLTTNAYGGAIVTVSSANQGLQGPGTNLIPSVANNGDPITANLGRYGFTMPNTTSGLGTINRNTNCSTGAAFCKLVTSATEVFNTNSLPLDTGRVRMDIAAAAKSTDNPGSYTDTLTFSAIATY